MFYKIDLNTGEITKEKDFKHGIVINDSFIHKGFLYHKDKEKLKNWAFNCVQENVKSLEKAIVAITEKLKKQNDLINKIKQG